MNNDFTNYGWLYSVSENTFQQKNIMHNSSLINVRPRHLAIEAFLPTQISSPSIETAVLSQIHISPQNLAPKSCKNSGS